MIKILSGTLTGNPVFTGGKVECISEIELWVNHYQFIAGSQQICYQPQGGAVVCIAGDTFNISSNETNQFQGGQAPDKWYLISFQSQIRSNQYPNWSPWGGVSNKRFYSYGGIKWIGPEFQSLVSPYSGIEVYSLQNGQIRSTSAVGGQYLPYAIEFNIYNINIIREDGTSLEQDILEGNLQYKIEIFKNNVKIHEHTSNNPISAWTETTPNKCIEGNWEKVSSWVQFPFDNLKIEKLGNVYWFWLLRIPVNSPVAIIRKKDDCKMPLYKLIVKPKWGKCKEKPEKKMSFWNCRKF